VSIFKSETDPHSKAHIEQWTLKVPSGCAAPCWGKQAIGSNPKRLWLAPVNCGGVWQDNCSKGMLLTVKLNDPVSLPCRGVWMWDEDCRGMAGGGRKKGVGEEKETEREWEREREKETKSIDLTSVEPARQERAFCFPRRPAGWPWNGLPFPHSRPSQQVTFAQDPSIWGSPKLSSRFSAGKSNTTCLV
jgi:hypothetical protein